MTASVLAGVLAVADRDVSPGVLGFLVVALLGGATYLLIRSMNRQIRRIDLPDDEDDADGAAGAGAAGAADGADDASRAERRDGTDPEAPGLSPR